MPANNMVRIYDYDPEPRPRQRRAPPQPQTRRRGRRRRRHSPLFLFAAGAALFAGGLLLGLSIAAAGRSLAQMGGGEVQGAASSPPADFLPRGDRP